MTTFINSRNTDSFGKDKKKKNALELQKESKHELHHNLHDEKEIICD